MDNLNETPILRINGLTVRYGKGCAHCKNGGELTKKPALTARRYGRPIMWILNFIREKS